MYCLFEIAHCQFVSNMAWHRYIWKDGGKKKAPVQMTYSWLCRHQCTVCNPQASYRVRPRGGAIYQDNLIRWTLLIILCFGLLIPLVSKYCYTQKWIMEQPIHTWLCVTGISKEAWYVNMTYYLQSKCLLLIIKPKYSPNNRLPSSQKYSSISYLIYNIIYLNIV